MAGSYQCYNQFLHMGITIKQAATEMDISESTVKKYLKDFELPTSGSGNKTEISDETLQALKEISKLRANGLTIQEIKELKSQEPTKSILEEIDETVKPVETSIKNTEDAELITEAIETETTLNGNGEVKSEEDEDRIAEEEGMEISDAGEQIQKSGEDSYPRRRGFNPRYVERQISQDSKRVSSLKLRLRNPNLPISERLFFEEALERRIVLLNGWRHILRWIAK